MRIKTKEDKIWNFSMADGMCFCLVAKTVRDVIVPLVMPFVGQPFYKLIGDFERQLHMHFVQPLEGLSTDKLSPMVHVIIQKLSNSSNTKPLLHGSAPPYRHGAITARRHCSTSTPPWRHCHYLYHYAALYFSNGSSSTPMQCF
ncbi:hypothetical protein LguiB_015508 [Lonicera macranthoides]